MQRTLAGSRHIRHSPYSLLSPVPLCLQWFPWGSLKGREPYKKAACHKHHPDIPLPSLSSETVSCLHRRSLYPLETLQNTSAWCNTEGVVTLDYALHLQAKYYHTQVNQKPSGAVSNHKNSLCVACSRTELSRYFSIFINQTSPCFSSWCTLQYHFIATADPSQICAAITPHPTKELSEEGWTADTTSWNWWMNFRQIHTKGGVMMCCNSSLISFSK